MEFEEEEKNIDSVYESHAKKLNKNMIRSSDLDTKEGGKVPTISLINEKLQNYESRLAEKIDYSQIAYEKFSSDLSTIESTLERKDKEKFGKLKGSAKEFISFQKDAMEVMADITRGIYSILENIA